MPRITAREAREIAVQKNIMHHVYEARKQIAVAAGSGKYSVILHDEFWGGVSYESDLQHAIKTFEMDGFRVEWKKRIIDGKGRQVTVIGW